MPYLERPPDASDQRESNLPKVMLETAGCISLLTKERPGTQSVILLEKMTFFGVSVRFQNLAKSCTTVSLL